MDKHTQQLKGTKEALGRYNARLVLMTLLEQDGLSRAEIARITGLSRATVSEIVARLIHEGFVAEGARDNRRGGKPSILLELEPGARMVVSVDLSGPNFRGALIDLRGNLAIQRIAPFDRDGGVSDVFTHILGLIESLIVEAKVPVIGIGVGCPGLVNPHEGVLRLALNQGWKNFQLGSALAEHFTLPTWLMNDHSAAALGEYVFGGHPTGSNLALIRYVAGIGLGMVLDGSPFLGDDFSSGEIGHVVVEPNGELCDCGNRGCLERLIGGRTIARKVRESIDSRGDTEMYPLKQLDDRALLDELLLRFRQGDPFPRPFYDEIATYLGDILASMQGILNVREVVLSGPLPTFDRHFIEKLRGEMAKRILPEMSERIHISHSVLGEDIVLLGTAAHVLSRELGIYEPGNPLTGYRSLYPSLGGAMA